MFLKNLSSKDDSVLRHSTWFLWQEGNDTIKMENEWVRYDSDISILESHTNHIKFKEVYSINPKGRIYENVYGEYHETLGFKWTEKNKWIRRMDLQGFQFRAIMLWDPGYTGIDQTISSFSPRNIDKVPWFGLFPEIFESLAHSMNFTYSLRSSRDGVFGTFDTDTGEWNGAIKDLIEGVADLGAISMFVSNIRSTAIDFSIPIYESYSVFLVSSQPSYSWDIFTKPFHSSTWLILYILIVCASIFLATVAKIGRDEKIEEFGLRKCFTFVFGAFSALAARRWSVTPKKISGR